MTRTDIFDNDKSDKKDDKGQLSEAVSGNGELSEAQAGGADAVPESTTGVNNPGTADQN